MTPQSQFTVVAPVTRGREDALRELLATMTSQPGVADPDNLLVPFGNCQRLHFARLVILEDPTLADTEAYGLPAAQLPVYLALLGDCDGRSRECLADLSRRAGDGLSGIFANCEDFKEPLLDWMLAHDRPPAVSYVNWVGRTVLQIGEESALQRALSQRVSRTPVASSAEAQQRWHDLALYVRREVSAGRLALTPDPATPLAWRLAKCANAVLVLSGTLIALPFLILFLPLLLLWLRRHEKTDPEICPPPDPRALLELQQLEDYDVTNQYTALGSVKPGPFRSWLLTAVLAAIQFTCRHVFTRGHLARVQTIHFARWLVLDDGARVMFASNYDGGHQPYMDDFINKVAWGLNLVFSNGIGWPRTAWLLKQGARREHLFKYYQRRHQIPTQVWYKAYPGLTLIDLARNHRIREGIERAGMSDSEVAAWLQLL